MAVVTAPGMFEIEQFAGDVGHVDLTVILVLGFEQTAFAAAIAQGFPLGAIQRFERRFPERLTGI
jgi:hypothetical protein